MSLKFTYRGTEFPNQNMKDWFNYSYNKPDDTMDSLELDIWIDSNRQDFFDDFSDDLCDLSYIEMLDIYELSKNY